LTLFDHPEFDDHESVVFCRSAEAGLTAVIAIHSTTLGPAAGGCRMYPYDSIDDALTDVLRLSRAMSYKNALADLELGGGKAVVIADPKEPGKNALLEAFAREVEALGGRYLTAEDIGVGIEDVEVMATVTRHVFGLTSSGDPSPFTARGAFQGIRAAVNHKLGMDSVEGLRVAVQGVGRVGFELCRLLDDAGAELVVTDVDATALLRAVDTFGAEPVGVDVIDGEEVDVFAPCAMGGVLNDLSVPRLKAVVVAGVANNQLAHDRHGDALHERGVLYAPDYVANAGGMLNASGDIFGSYDEEAVLSRIDGIYDRMLEIFERSRSRNVPPHRVAFELARKKITRTEAL